MTSKALFVLLASALVMEACSGSSSAPAPSPSPTTSTTPTITITGQRGSSSFTPNPASFGGQQVVFKNADSVMHRVVLNDGSVDTGDIAPGATSGPVLMPGGGTNYHCSLHPAMVGAVGGATGSAPPTCDGPYC